MKWIFIQEVSAMGFWYEEYVSEDGHYGKIVWYDGEEEIYELTES